MSEEGFYFGVSKYNMNAKGDTERGKDRLR
jgi:hypothetical protein